MISITFLQTCDAVRYISLLDLGSRTVKAYIAKFGYSYTSFVGLKRGHLAWHATYNRIPILMEMVDAGYRGWVCYMDADSYIADLDFELDKYLADKSGMAMIVAHSGAQSLNWFAINAGVFLLNLNHQKAIDLVRLWYAKLMAISDAAFKAADLWIDIKDDQILLCEAMQEIPDLREDVIVDASVPRLFNYHNGRFIRQVIREGIGTVEERARIMAADIDTIISETVAKIGRYEVIPHPDVAAFEESFVRALYRTFLLRDPEIGELYHAVKLYRLKQCSLEEEIRGIMISPEFASKSTEFIRRFAPSADVLKN